MNYLKIIKAAKNANENGLSPQMASEICSLIKTLAEKMYDWDLIRDHYSQFNAIMELANNMMWNYKHGR